MISAWSDSLLPELIVSRGTRRRATTEALAARILALPESGHSRLRFHQIIESLRDAVRSRWGALLKTADVPLADGSAELDRTVERIQPAHGFEAREEFTTLVRAVEHRIGALEIDEAGRDYLDRLWAFARALASEAQSWPASRRYSRSAVAESLSSPRNRMPTLCAALERLVHDCGSNS